jgi:uncharacterized protein (DUF302 family)
MKYKALILTLLLAVAMATSGSVIADAETAKGAEALVVERTIKADYLTTVNTLRQQLKDDGWRLMAEVDLGTRLARKGVEVPGGLVIFKLTSGKNAMPLLAKDETRYISAMMPCGVSVYGKSDGSVVISRMKFEMMSPMMEPEVAAVMKKSITQLTATIDAALAKLAAE